MKTKFTLLTLLLLFVATFNYAQTSAEIADIAVQGIARDNNNTALTNQTVNLTFTIYYNNPGPVNVYVVNKAVQTDAFGVFSHILNVEPNTNSKFAKYQMFLRIEDNNGVISDEKLKHVPYAVTANNGVPTGAIMPFMGTTAPEGWVLCDGRTLNGIAGSEELQILLNDSNVPDLQGFFLRGAGTNGFTPVNTVLGVPQDDTNLSHTHASGSLGTSASGAHTHTFSYEATESSATSAFLSSGGNGGNRTLGGQTSSAGNHSHAIFGNTAAAGASESRPVHYGVNYIIKL